MPAPASGTGGERPPRHPRGPAPAHQLSGLTEATCGRRGHLESEAGGGLACVASGGSGDTHRLCTQVKHPPSRGPASRPHPKYRLPAALPPAAVQPGRRRRGGRLGRRQGFPRGRAARGAPDQQTVPPRGHRPRPAPRRSRRPWTAEPAARAPARRALVVVAQAEGHLALSRGVRTLPRGADIRPETWKTGRKDENPGKQVLSGRNEWMFQVSEVKGPSLSHLG